MGLYKLKLTYRKSGYISLYSHLDMARFWERALRRTDLPFYVTQGFNPHPKISFYGGLKLGIEGEETAVFYFRQEVPEKVFSSLMRKNCPGPLELIRIEQVP